MKVYPGTITSSPGPIPSAESAVISAAVPEVTASACFVPNFCSTISSSVFTFRLNAGSFSSP